MNVLLQFGLLLIFTVCKISGDPYTITMQGVVEGQFLQTVNGRKFTAFTSIPYAEPPIGELRFKRARPAKPWSGIRNATVPHASCPQSNLYYGDPTVFGDEDCLYLNVYTPQLNFGDGESRPVMIFLHGGGFLSGSGNQALYPPGILLDKNIVLVVPNYRLGPLGFLCTGDDIAPGNDGLKDQNLVIQWVKQNIIFFGGNFDDITLFGQSAGGASAHFHMLSPLSKGLIKKVISQSGTALASWALAVDDEGVKNTKRMAQAHNCTIASSQEMVDCLRNVNAHDLIRTQDSFYVWSVDPLIPFRPVIEKKRKGAFLWEHPIQIIKSNKAAKIPFITGINTEEGGVRSSGIFGNPTLLQEFNDDFQRIAPFTFLYADTAPDKDLVTSEIREFYFGNSTIDISSRTPVTNVYTDASFLSSANLAVQLHHEYTTHPVYFYAFGYRNVISFSMLLGDPSYYYGVVHLDELLYLFPPNLYFPNYVPSASDKKVSEVLTTLWSNFAKFGNPTPTRNSLIRRKWNAVSSDNLEYYFIRNYTELNMRDNLYPERSQFWEHLPLN